MGFAGAVLGFFTIFNAKCSKDVPQNLRYAITPNCYKVANGAHISAIRIVPSCAGNAAGVSALYARPSVHPRVCGERACRQRNTKLPAGSSPRVRGTRDDKTGDGQPARFIPACAGNAAGKLLHFCNVAVHPRVCGERGVGRGDGGHGVGSSPRVRGTHGPVGDRRTVARFIPACAGNAINSARIRSIWAVHPRVCGERSSISSYRICTSGSSPRVRGTRQAVLDPVAKQRFIPACAGNA